MLLTVEATAGSNLFISYHAPFPLGFPLVSYLNSKSITYTKPEVRLRTKVSYGHYLAAWPSEQASPAQT